MINPIQKSNKNYSFFARMLLICTILLAMFAIISSLIISNLSKKYEQTRFLNNYEMAITNLSETFSNRHGSFHILCGKLLSGGQCNPSISTLLESPSYNDVTAAVRHNITVFLASLIRDDRYLDGFLIYSPKQETLYSFMENDSFLSAAATLPEMPEIIPYSGTLIDNASVNDMLLACNVDIGDANGRYGMAATIYTKTAEPLGYLIPLYATSEFENVLSNYQLDSDSIFYIADSADHIYYQSYPYQSNGSTVQYTNTISNRQLKYNVGYEIMKYVLPKSVITYLITIFAIIVTVFSFGLYYLTYYLSRRNMHGILSGMHQFSVDNLTYRIPELKGRHEFSRIIHEFNNMCEKLQRNVERSYVYELQQKKSELYALQTSINPHFLYNTLEIIRNQIQHENNQNATQMLLLLSKIYRSQTSTEMFVTLENEVELCENLMILYQYRFQNFDYEFQIDEEAEYFALPKNTLQPLIENYFVHGIIAGRQDNLLILSVTLEEEADRQYIKLSLSDNGNPITGERIAEISQRLKKDIYSRNTDGFALANVYSRLRIVFKEDCSMKISKEEDGMSFHITITFPCITVSKLKEEF